MTGKHASHRYARRGLIGACEAIILVRILQQGWTTPQDLAPFIGTRSARTSVYALFARLARRGLLKKRKVSRIDRLIGGFGVQYQVTDAGKRASAALVELAMALAQGKRER